MNHARKFLLLVSVAFTWACTVPTLADLDKGQSKCDAARPCASGWKCFNNVCLADEDTTCEPEETQVCAKKEGVCQGAKEVCPGNFQGCTPAIYAAHSPQYQVFEMRCDDVDNDCDGDQDAWRDPLPVNQESNSFTLAATGVRRGALDKPDTVLTLSTEVGGLRARTLSSEGLQQGEGFAPPANNVTLQSPALVAEGDAVAAAWIENTFSSTPEYAVQVAMLDGSGKVIRGKVDVFHADSQRTLSPPRLVMSPTHLLVLIEVTVNFTQEFWAVTINRNLDRNSRSVPVLLGTSRLSKWFHAASVRGPNEYFLVTYEQGGERKLVGLSNQGILIGSARALPPALNGATSMPFIVPANPSSPMLHTIFYVEDNLQGLFNIRYVKCNNELCEAPQMALANYTRRIEDMQLGTLPGDPNPALVLLRWSAPHPTDPTQPDIHGHSVAPLSNDHVGTLSPLALRARKVYSEVLVLLPDGEGFTGFVAYVDEAPQQGPPIVPVARMQPFCMPRPPPP